MDVTGIEPVTPCLQSSGQIKSKSLFRLRSTRRIRQNKPLQVGLRDKHPLPPIPHLGSESTDRLTQLYNIEYSKYGAGRCLFAFWFLRQRSFPMKTAIRTFALPPFLSTTLLAAAFVISFGPRLAAQQPGSNSVDIQREAMHKLSFLAGHWSGPVTIFRGPGEPLHLTQMEDVEYKLDGLVLVVEGKSTSADGKVQFSALATIAYDDATHTYRFRAYHEGRYLDTELSVPANGFSWSFAAGPAHIVNTMHLTEKGEWEEATDATVGSNPPFRSVEMLLQRQP